MPAPDRLRIFHAMNNPRMVFKTLSELYQFNKKLAKAYSIPQPHPRRISENSASPFPPVPQALSSRMSNSGEIFDLYDVKEYRIVGRATRGECHGNPRPSTP